jgi:O-Antigen ligase
MTDHATGHSDLRAGGATTDAGIRATRGVASPSDTVWSAGLVAALFVVPVAAHVVLGDLGPSWLPGVLAAGIAVAGFAWRPVPALLVTALYLLFIDTIQLSAGPGIKVMDELAIPAIAVVTLIRRWREIPAAWSWVRELSVIVLVAVALVSSLINGVAATVWLPGMLLLCKGFAMFYVARLLSITDDQVRWAMRVGLGVGIVVLIVGAVELVAPGVLTSIGLGPSQERVGLPAVKSLFYHPQLFGWFCAFNALFLIAHHGLLRRRWMLGLAIVFSMATILSARRRAMLSLVAGFVSGAIVDATSGRRGAVRRALRWLPATVSLVVLSIAFLPALVGLYQLTIDRYAVDSGIGGTIEIGPLTVDVGSPDDAAGDAKGAPARVALYQASLLVARDHFPLGAGLGRFGSWMSRTEYSDLYHEYGLDRVYGLSPQNPVFITDTFWPQVLGELGVIGLAAYGVFLGAVGVSLVRLYRRHRELLPVAAVILSAGMILGQTIVESLASPILNSPPQTYLIMLTLGGVLAWKSRGPVAAVRDPAEDEAPRVRAATSPGIG